MARGKYLSLEEARKMGKLDRFAKEHPSEGDEEQWDELFEVMAKGNGETHKPPRPVSAKK